MRPTPFLIAVALAALVTAEAAPETPPGSARSAASSTIAPLSPSPSASPPVPTITVPPVTVAASPSPYDDDMALPAHAADVADYTLRATLDPILHMVHGEGRIDWRNRSRVPVHDLWLHLYLNAFKNERSAFLRERVGGRGSTTPEDWGWIDVRKLTLRDASGAPIDLMSALELHRAGDDDETDAHVTLPYDVQPDDAIAIDVAFDDKLPSIVERTGYRDRYHLVGQWFPKVARLEPDGTWAHFPFHHLAEFYADFGRYDVTLDVPEAFTIGATGPVIEEKIENGRRVERHVQDDVHDFAWTAWDRWRSAREVIDDVDVTVLYPPGFGAMADRELAAIRFALPYDGRHFGRYPYKVLTVVHPQQDAAESGGMEYPTFITSGSPWLTPSGVLAPEIVTVHELGHQWFYGLVATNELAWPVLDEGINQFVEVETMGAWRGPGSALDMDGLTVSDAALQAVSSNRAVHDEPVAQPADAFTSGANYGRLVYARTASVLETLARVYGRDPVLQALGRYARRNRFEHPGPEALLAAFGEVLGPRVAATLKTALFDEGWVDYVVDGVWSEHAHAEAGVFDRNGDRETVAQHDESDWQGTVLVRRRGTLSFPVDVDLVMADGSTTRERWDGAGESTRIAWRGASPIRAAIVDPEERVLVDASRENNHAATGAGTRSATHTLERMTYFMQLALQAVSP